MLEIKVKILGISGSPIKGGNCDTLVQAALSSAAEMGGVLGGVETEFITLAGSNITMCNHCQWCIENMAPCRVEDDARWIWEKITECDGLILGAPTWAFTLAPPMTILFSKVRYYAFFTQKLRNKVVGYITLGFFGFGLEQSLDTMENFTKPIMLPVARGWAIPTTAAFGGRPAYLEHGVLDDKAGMRRVKNVAIRVVEVARMIKYATQSGIVLPDEYTFTVTGERWPPLKKKVFVDGVWRDTEET